MTYYPVTTYQGRSGAMGSTVHLMSEPRVRSFTPSPSRTLCNKRAAERLPGTAEDATCAVCRLKAGVSRRR
jgi:hypothetical protein